MENTEPQSKVRGIMNSRVRYNAFLKIFALARAAVGLVGLLKMDRNRL